MEIRRKFLAKIFILLMIFIGGQNILLGEEEDKNQNQNKEENKISQDNNNSSNISSNVSSDNASNNYGNISVKNPDVKVSLMPNSVYVNSTDEITSTDIPMGEYQAADYFYVYDPFEGFNRRMYFFNYYSETYVIMPIVNAYKFILPNFMEDGVSNFYDNSRMIPVMGNSILQTKGRKFMRAVARFSINTVIGIFGLFDVASRLGMPKDYEDFGLTLQHYGVPKGPFLILPIFGPSFLRDAPGLAVDAIVIATTNPLYLGGFINKYERLWFAALYGVDLRKRIAFSYYGMGTPFEYEYIRFFYQRLRTVQEVMHEQ
ncbi:MAG: MlaA family lipoprotein [Fusobacteriaceae bacterium]